MTSVHVARVFDSNVPYVVLHHRPSPPFHRRAQHLGNRSYYLEKAIPPAQLARLGEAKKKKKKKKMKKFTVAEVVSNQPEPIKEALDVVAFRAVYKSIAALTTKAECFLIMLVIHSLWSPSMMTAFAKHLILSFDISATGALALLECVITADWSAMAKSEIELYCPHYWRSCPGPMHLSEVKDGLEKNWEKFEALAVSASSLPYLTCRIAFGQVTDSLKKLGAGNGEYTSAHYMRDLVIAQGAVVPGRAPLLMSPKLYEKLPEADRLVVPKEYSPCEWAYMVCMAGKKQRSTEFDEALVAKLVCSVLSRSRLVMALRWKAEVWPSSDGFLLLRRQVSEV